MEQMRGGEVFIPKLPSARLSDLIAAIAPDAKKTVAGIRPGAKLHECLLSEDEARHTVELEDMFVLEPEAPSWAYVPWKGKHPKEGWEYASDTNTEWLKAEQLKTLF